MDDPRFARGVELFNEREFLEASDCFEDLFFEAVRDEVPIVRVMMQFSVGAWHALLGQWRPAVERIEEGISAAREVTNDYGFDVAALVTGMAAAARAIRNRVKPEWPRMAQRQLG